MQPAPCWLCTRDKGCRGSMDATAFGEWLAAPSVVGRGGQDFGLGGLGRAGGRAADFQGAGVGRQGRVTVGGKAGEVGGPGRQAGRRFCLSCRGRDLAPRGLRARILQFRNGRAGHELCSAALGNWLAGLGSVVGLDPHKVHDDSPETFRPIPIHLQRALKAARLNA